jgi:hypothetical protein
MTHFCDTCGRDFTNRFCPRCGGPPASRTPEPDVPAVFHPVSDLGDTLDSMIEQASRPTLASLLKRGIDSGLIKPSQEYSNGSPTP